MNMNIIHLLSNKVWGSPERYALDLCKTLRADGFNTLVFCCSIPNICDIFAKENLLGGTMPFTGIRSIITPVILASHLNKLEGKTVIHVHNLNNVGIAINARKLTKNPKDIKIIATCHTAKLPKPNTSEQSFYNNIDAFIFTSKLAFDTFVSLNPSIKIQKLHLIHNSVALEPYKPKSESSAIQLIYLGNILPEKGVDFLINALGKLKKYDWKLTVCGAGPGRFVMPIVRAARSLGINERIEWKGHIDEILPELRKAHIAVFPSKEKDTISMAIIEAMSQGCAIVTIDNDIHREILSNNKTGLLIDTSNTDSLVLAIQNLLESQHLRDVLSQNAFDHFKEDLSYSNFYEKTLKIIKNINSDGI